MPLEQPDGSAEWKHFSALSYPDFRALWIGMVFASGTVAFQYYAQMWLIYSITESAWILGGLGVARGLATLLFGLWGGALADRMDRRLLLFVTEGAALLVSLVLGLMVLAGVESLWLIFLLIFITSVLSSVDAPIRQALIPELVPARHIPNAVALTTAAYWGSFAITPILAGFVIAAIGPGGAYLVSTLGNVGILVALVLLKYRGTPRQARHEPVWQTIRFGISFARHQPIILWIMLLTFVTSAFCFALFHGIIAKWAASILLLGPGQYGALAATWGVGTLAASYTMSYLGQINNHGRILLISSLLFGLSFLVFGLTRFLPIVGIAYIVNGAAWICASISSTAIIQSITPNEVRGRVMSLFMVSGAVAQMNSLSLGLVADQVGLAMLVPATSLLCVLLVIGLIIAVPGLRNLDQSVVKIQSALHGDSNDGQIGIN